MSRMEFATGLFGNNPGTDTIAFENYRPVSLGYIGQVSPQFYSDQIRQIWTWGSKVYI